MRQKTLLVVIALRPERGYSGTNYDASVVETRNPYDLNLAVFTMPIKFVTAVVIAIRSERSYSGSNYDVNPVKYQKSLRPQFGRFYDDN